MSTLNVSKLCDARNKVTGVKTDICKKLSISDIKKFTTITPQSIAKCIPYTKPHIGQHLLDIISVCDSLFESNIDLEPHKTLDISDIELAISTSIVKEFNDIKISNEFDLDTASSTISGDIKKLDALVKELKMYSVESVCNWDSPATNFNPSHLEGSPTDFANPTKHIEEYTPEFISEELESELNNFLDTEKFKSMKNGWSAVDYGELYKYTGSPKSQTTPPPIPEPIKKVIELIRTKYENCDINQCTVNKYVDSSAKLSEHSDDEDTIKPESDIFTVSLGSLRSLTFRDVATGVEKVVTPETRSIYIMSQPSQCLWTHRMDAGDPRNIVKNVRFSITLRCVGSKYKNSCIIIGDSNTKHLKFGNTAASFRDHMPGKRVQALTISDIDPASCIGYRNIIVHVGINNLKTTNIPMLYNDRKNVNVYEQFTILTEKIGCIRSLCKKSNIVVSPILPTKIDWLNQRALEFNKYLFEYLCTVDIRHLDFNTFLDSNCLKLDDSYGCYNSEDKIHLGKNGIRTLAKLIKDAVLKRVRDGRSFASVTCDKVGRGTSALS